MWGPPNLSYTVNDSSDQNSAYIKKSHVSTDIKTLRKLCPNNTSRSSLSRKLVPAGLLHHPFHIRSPKTEEEEEN